MLIKRFHLALFRKCLCMLIVTVKEIWFDQIFLSVCHGTIGDPAMLVGGASDGS